MTRTTAKFAAGLWLGGAALGAAGEVDRLASGMLLFAVPELTDPNFVESVVVLVQHGPSGAMGLIVNKPTRLTAAELLPEIEGVAALKLYFGGPVQPEGVLALLRTERRPEGALAVVDGVYLSGRKEDLARARGRGDPERRLRLYAGYAGWAPGQLENEVRRGDWVLAPADAETIFSEEPDYLWRRVYRLLRRLEVHMLDPFGGLGVNYAARPRVRAARRPSSP